MLTGKTLYQMGQRCGWRWISEAEKEVRGHCTGLLVGSNRRHTSIASLQRLDSQFGFLPSFYNTINFHLYPLSQDILVLHSKSKNRLYFIPRDEDSIHFIDSRKNTYRMELIECDVVSLTLLHTLIIDSKRLSYSNENRRYEK